MDNFKLILKIIATNLVLAVFLIFLVTKPETDVVTSTFCAYGKVFVEFKNGKNVWGTLMLDRVGFPIPCKEEPDIATDQPIEYKGFNI